MRLGSTEQCQATTGMQALCSDIGIPWTLLGDTGIRWSGG